MLSQNLFTCEVHMTLKRIFTCLLALAMIACFSTVAQAEPWIGPRVPLAYFATTGTGQSDQGIPPDPYETFSYDLALLEAGIENFNVVYYTSVLPRDSYEVSLDAVKKTFTHGAVLESIMAKAGGEKGDTVCAGIGRVWAVDSGGAYIGGFAAEYEYVYNKQTVDPATAEANAKKQLMASLNHELSIRGLSQQPNRPMKFNITSLQITENYGIALAALGFITFDYPKVAPPNSME